MAKVPKRKRAATVKADLATAAKKEGFALHAGEHYDEEERARQLQYIEGLWLRGLPRHRIIAAAVRELGVSTVVAGARLHEAQEEAVQEHEANRKHYKAAAIRRLHNHIALAQQPVRSQEKLDAKGKVIEPSKIIKQPQWGAVAQLERLLSDIQGTREPIRVEVHVALHTAVLNCLGSMSIDDMDKLVEAYGEVKDQAALALPAPRPKDATRVASSNGSHQRSS